MNVRRCLISLLIVCCCGFSQWAYATSQEYVLMLESIPFNHTRPDDVYQIVSRNLKAQHVQLAFHTLNIPFIQSVNELHQKQAELTRKYNVPPKLVICLGDPAWLFCKPIFDGAWKDVPSVICYARDFIFENIEHIVQKDSAAPSNLLPTTEMIKKYNATCVMQPLYPKENIELLLKLQPKMKRIAYVFDNRYISGLSYENLKAAVEKYYPKLQLLPITTPQYSVDQLVDSLTSFDETTGVLYYSWFVNREICENKYLLDNMRKISSTFSHVPIFTMISPDEDKDDFAGGYFISEADLSRSIADIAMRILHGTRADQIPVQSGGQPHAYLNYEQLVKHGISKNLLPKDAIYSSIPLSFWQEYRLWIIMSSVIFVLFCIILFMRIRMYIQERNAVKAKRLADLDRDDMSRKLQMILHAGHFIIWKCDLNNNCMEINRHYSSHEDGSEDNDDILNDKDKDEHIVMNCKEVMDCIHPDDREEALRVLNELREGKIKSKTLELRFKWKGSYRWIEAFASSGELNKDGSIKYLVGGSSVIDRRKEMEAQIREKARLEESNRLKSAFLANMSHEIRTPLNAIVGFSNLIAQANDTEENQQFLEIIEQNNDYLLEMVNNLLDFSKIEADQLEFIYSDFNLSDLMSTLNRTFSRRVPEDVKLIMQIPDKPLIIHSERYRISQILTNFLSNACKFTTQGSITFGYEIENSTILFYVTDTGEGIDPKFMPHVFERFAKDDDFGQGGGIGLSISHKIAEELGGEIGAESEKDKGSRFWLRIPKDVPFDDTPS